MYIINRKGEKEPVAYEKIVSRVRRMCSGLDYHYVDANLVAQKVVASLESGMHTSRIDQITIEECIKLAIAHPDYLLLAGRIAISDLQKRVPKAGGFDPILENAIVHGRDDVFENITMFREFCNRYVRKDEHGLPVERIQHVLMRMAIKYTDTQAKAIEMYKAMSNGYYLPVQLNAVRTTLDENTCVKWMLASSAEIEFCMSKYHITNELIDMIDCVGAYTKSKINLSIDAWHMDISKSLELKARPGDCVYVPRLLIQRAIQDNDGIWSTFDPVDVPDLLDAKDDAAFEEAYARYENMPAVRKTQCPADTMLWALASWCEKTPSNRLVFGTCLTSGALAREERMAVALNLTKFVTPQEAAFDADLLVKIVRDTVPSGMCVAIHGFADTILAMCTSYAADGMLLQQRIVDVLHSYNLQASVSCPRVFGHMVSNGFEPLESITFEVDGQPVVYPTLVRHLVAEGQWDTDVRDMITIGGDNDRTEWMTTTIRDVSTGRLIDLTSDRQGDVIRVCDSGRHFVDAVKHACQAKTIGSIEYLPHKSHRYTLAPITRLRSIESVVNQ
jgi:hypothetical protein